MLASLVSLLCVGILISIEDPSLKTACIVTASLKGKGIFLLTERMRKQE